ncbi:COP9 signalosome complex subunit 4 [Cyberlindnera fabianii]|uniref:COP9 signalosome complex subunit 4 n=1 Tax=Cyberlindnera fabianii TaxID=36022 RepID=A0A1V2LBF2_CYBFA|nr:COP9 signalosome complex subunit 4 [Cyberlindnera fabianii]
MASRALLQVSEVANGDSTTKESDVLALLISQDPNDHDGVVNYIKAITKQQTLPVKTILGDYVDHITTSSSISQPAKRSIYELLITQFTPPTPTVSIALTKTIHALVPFYEASKLHTEAIDALKILNTDVNFQDFSTVEDYNIFRINVNTRIAENCLAIHDYESAESHLTRISPLLSEVEDTATVKRTNALSVKIMARMHKWLDAASRLLLMDEQVYDATTVLYAILAPWSQFKENLFQNVKKSEHILANVVGSPLGVLFGKVDQKRVIYADEVSKAIDYVGAAELDVGVSLDELKEILQTAIIESNLMSCSLIFENITLESFAGFLKMNPEVVEDIAAACIRADSIKASVDDISKTIYFTDKKFSALKDWQDHIVRACTILDNVASDIAFENVLQLPRYK